MLSWKVLDAWYLFDKDEMSPSNITFKLFWQFSKLFHENEISHATLLIYKVTVTEEDHNRSIYRVVCCSTYCSVRVEIHFVQCSAPRLIGLVVFFAEYNARIWRCCLELWWRRWARPTKKTKVSTTSATKVDLDIGVTVRSSYWHTFLYHWMIDIFINYICYKYGFFF